MKKTFLKSLSKLSVLAVLGFATLFISCEKEAPETFEQQETVQKQTRDIYLNTSGENTSKGRVFVGVAGQEFLRDIKIFYNQVPQEWIAPTNRALGEWSSINNFLNMRRVLSRANADIVISGEAEIGLDRSPAGADFPDVANGPVGRFVTINLNYDNLDPVLTPNLRYYIMIHELGHNLGLQHYGPVSFMAPNVTEANENWGGISPRDANAISNILFSNVINPL
ncbi:matrixin family metalloprotease [Aquimarina sp. I32.4]|uniref:matrixin family metalloprotease n=1 Tax=Aquimarina sp. I32.4 TaxID=2053903 RepID=UPI000CDF023C|nr:matrixin family metalloprotease [Aquimarina sp. I32.4]